MSSPNTCFSLKIKHTNKDRLYWNLFNIIPFLIGSIAIARDSLKLVAVYIGLALLFFLVIEFRFACTHCLHYIRSKGCVKCMMLWGVPKVFKERPGPHSPFERAMTILGALPVFFFPLPYLFRNYLLFGAYIVAWALFGLTARRYECGRCINFECPMNRVPVEVKKEFESKEKFEMSEWKV